MNERVIQATFSDWRTVKTRKSLQLIFEVPLEQQEQVLKMLGAPMPDQEIWCVIARLNLKVVSEQPKELEAPKKSRAQMAAILCSDARFWAFLSEKYGYSVRSPEDAAEAVRDLCAVSSRSELDRNEAAAFCWDEVRSEWQAFKVIEGVH